MIKSVTATNFLGESIKMELTKPWDSGFYIKSIDGLGPPKANINITDISGVDGGEYNSARAENKNLVLSLGLLENPDIETMRLASYKYFPLKKKVTITVETDQRIASVEGYVESNEPDIFSEEESIQISIICPNPYWHTDDNITVFSGVQQLFEFPFSNEISDNDYFNIELGEYRDDRYKVIHYDGDVDTGIRAYIRVLDDVNYISIINATTREVFTIESEKIAAIPDLGTGLSAGDELLISTIKGDRYIQLYRNGTWLNILNAMSANSKWITLYSGDNVMSYDSNMIANLDFKILNNVLYEGL